MTDLTKQRIIELIPEIMELKPGCEILAGFPRMKHVIYGHDDDEGTWYGYLARPFPADLEANSYYDIEIDAEALHEVEILGRPITLADVLRAMTQGMTRPGDWVLDTGGRFWEILKTDNEGGWVMEPHRIRWQLSTDYDSQTQETKDFIGKLLNA